MATDAQAAPRRARVSVLNDPRIRSIAYQLALCALIVFLFYAAISNAVDNLARARIATGFGFWNNTAGFDISQTLIEYSAQSSSYGRAFWVGLINTLLVGGLGILFATILGFVIGIARLSRNWLLARVAGGYVEIIRNLPLLLQLFFWYNAVLKALPDIRDSVVLPRPVFEPGSEAVAVAVIAGVLAALAFRMWARRRQEQSGRQAPVFIVTLLLVIGLPALVAALMGLPVSFLYPELARFNITGGIEMLPEFAALLFGLVIYTAAFIAEVVRAGILSVSIGQTEAAYSLGLRPRPTLRQIVMPQAMRVIIPPLTSQYLNLVKNSSLAVAIGYPDLVQVFTGTVLNQTGQAVEVVAVTMAVYLFISLFASALMNLYNWRLARAGEAA